MHLNGIIASSPVEVYFIHKFGYPGLRATLFTLLSWLFASPRAHIRQAFTDADNSHMFSSFSQSTSVDASSR